MRFLIIILIGVSLSSCAYRDEVKAPETAEVPSKEARAEDRRQMFVYGRHSNAKELTLNFGGEPILLACGYIKLVGTVLGDDPQAVVEVGGKGVLLSLSDRIGDYRVISIIDKEVKICSGR